MKVLFALEATSGGTRRHVLDLLPALAKRGAKCSLVYSPLRNPGFTLDAGRLKQIGIQIDSVTMQRGFGGVADATALRTLRRIILLQSPDIVHCHSTKAGFLGRLAALGTDAKVVYTPHCLAFSTGLPKPERRAALWVEKLLANATSHFIAVSKHELKQMNRARLTRSTEASLIYNGIEIDSKFREPSSGFRVPKASPLIGCFGRLSRQKNQSTLVRAFTSFRENYPKAGLMLVGGGEDKAMLRNLVDRLNLSDKIIFTDQLEEPRALYSQCDLVVQPSRWESCSYTLLEAMAASRTIVTSAAGGSPELVGETAMVLPYPTPQKLADAMSEVMSDENFRNDSGKAARTRVQKYFTLERMADKTIQLYHRVLTEKK